ncbi:hypothetical protein GF345_02860 [Candidatus Woesearchaeota archaeon]|nr:hypothetical protein [Candidatus Woesearchaeota archaeon]
MAEKHSKKEVIEYIKEQLDSGQSVDHIKAHLMSYGHDADELESLFEEILKEEETVKSKTVSRAVEILYVVIFIIFIFWVGASSKSPGETVVFGFSPTLLYIILTIVLLEKLKKTDITLVLMPIALVFLFFIIGSIGEIPMLAGMEIGKLTVLNMILSYIFLFALRYSEFMSRITLSREHLDEEDEPEEELEETKGQISELPEAPSPDEGEYLEMQQEDHEPIQKLMHSLESHSKSLNSVVGRVYRKSNGGTRLLRELIEVKKEWYNQFNHLEKSLDKQGILDVVDKIERRLNVMFKTEKEMFGQTSIKNLRRDTEGNSRIIDVLIMNDNDPVETYFEEALVICGKIREKAHRM